MDSKKIRIVLLIVCTLVFSQGCLSSEDGKFGVTLKEGSLILPDGTRISIGDSFESLEFLSPRYLESYPKGDVYILTDSSSIIAEIDYDNEEITLLFVHLYSLDNAWTEVEKVDVEGMIEVSRGMMIDDLVTILHDRGLSYESDGENVSVELDNNYKASFRFSKEIKGELERVYYLKLKLPPNHQ